MAVVGRKITSILQTHQQESMTFPFYFVMDRVALAKKGYYTWQRPSVHLSVHLLPLSRLNRLTYNLHMVCRSTMTLASLVLQVKVVGQRSRSNAKNRIFTSLLHCFKVKSRGQGHRSRPNFWHAAVDIRRDNHLCQSKVIVCVSVISGRMGKLHGCRRSAFNVEQVVKGPYIRCMGKLRFETIG